MHQDAGGDETGDGRYNKRQQQHGREQDPDLHASHPPPVRRAPIGPKVTREAFHLARGPQPPTPILETFHVVLGPNGPSDAPGRARW